MWISQQLKPQTLDTDADLGQVTVSGPQTNVLARGEIRALPVYGPGGYIWQPSNGEEVLVIKGGPGGEESCIAGAKQPVLGTAMLPGEVQIVTPSGASIYLQQDGTITIQGRAVNLSASRIALQAGQIALSGSVTVNGRFAINGNACQFG